MKEQSKKTVAKKKFFKMVFSRAGIFVILILIQLLVFLGIPYYLKEYATFIYSAMSVMEIVVLVYIINTEGNPAFKMTWMLCVMALPVIGTVFYIYVHLQLETRFVQNRLAALRMETEPYMDQDEKVTEALWASKSANAQLSYYLSHQLGFPTYRNTEVEYFPVGEDKFASMIKELEKAEKFIFMEYFIISEGYLWDTVLEILKEKAAAGVDVRLIYDDFGCVTTLPYQYYKSLQQMGIKCAAFNQFRPVLNVILNNRDHRKIAVIDGHTAFTGGINLADEYINRKERFGHWKDSGICLHGEAVWSFTVMFLQMWSTITGMECDFESYRPEIYHEEAFKKDGFVQPYGDSPLDGETVGEHVYLNIISQAKKYLYIFTPYLIPDNETLTALCMAAKRGVDVRIVTPGIPDKKIVYILTQANYEILLESGVQIYQYTPGFIHSKSFVCDDEVATVGTINMDYRSMYLHFECGVWMYGSSAVAQVKEDALITFEQCEQINMDYCRKKNFAVRALRGALKFLAPLL